MNRKLPVGLIGLSILAAGLVQPQPVRKIAPRPESESDLATEMERILREGGPTFIDYDKLEQPARPKKGDYVPSPTKPRKFKHNRRG